MAESKVRDGNYYVVQSFMVKEFNLKGLEKDVYAIIYGFSQAENQKFDGGLQYLVDWTHASKQGVLNALKSLQEIELIIKEERFINGVKFVEYQSTQFNGGGKHSLPNNKDINNKDKENKKESPFEGFEFTEKVKAMDYTWLGYKKEKGQTYKPVGLNTLLKKIDKWQKEFGEEYVVNAIDNSITNNYAGLFPAKTSTNQKPKESFKSREYTTDELNSVYDNLDDVELE